MPVFATRAKMLAAVALVTFVVAVPVELLAAEPSAPSADWPQFRGPNSDSIAANSPKLLDKWSAAGPKRVWKSDALPFAPLCGVGTPVVAGGKVFTFAQVELPQAGMKPFTPEILAEWGWSADVPDELWQKMDKARVHNQKFQAALKAGKEAHEAYVKEFVATLDPAQAKRFAEVIRINLGLKGWFGLPGSLFDSSKLKWMASMKDKEIKTQAEFFDLFVNRYGSGFFHSGLSGVVGKYAKRTYKKNQKIGDSMICLDAATGKELWRKTLAPGMSKVWGTGFGCSGVPAVVKDKVYFAGSGGIYCLDIKKKGELVWRAKGAASHTSPVVADGVAYFCAGELAAYNADTGKELWRQPKVKNDTASPVLWKNNGKTYVLCTLVAPRYYYVLFCVDAADGMVLWQERTKGANVALALAGDTMVVRDNGGCRAYRISPQKAEKLWTSKAGADYGGSPIIYRDHVYMCGRAYGKELITVLDLRTGAVTLKRNTDAAHRGGGACTTGIVADGKIIYVTEYDYKVARLIMFKADPKEYELVGRLPKSDVVSCTSPAFANGKVYIRMPTAMACYDLTGK